MSVKVMIPAPLRALTNNRGETELTAVTIRALIDALEGEFPGIKARLCDEKGAIRRFVNFYVNDEDIRFLKHDMTELKDGDTVSIVPAVAGG